MRIGIRRIGFAHPLAPGRASADGRALPVCRLARWGGGGAGVFGGGDGGGPGRGGAVARAGFRCSTQTTHRKPTHPPTPIVILTGGPTMELPLYVDCPVVCRAGPLHADRALCGPR